MTINEIAATKTRDLINFEKTCGPFWARGIQPGTWVHFVPIHLWPYAILAAAIQKGD